MLLACGAATAQPLSPTGSDSPARQAAAAAGVGTDDWRPEQAAGRLDDPLVAGLEADPTRCAAVKAGDAGARRIALDIAAFKLAVPAAAGVPFEVLDCHIDGFVHRGERIVISARLSQRPAAQRFFIIAHELGHLRLRHHAAMARFVSHAASRTAGETAAGAAIDAGSAPLSRQNELEADAYAAWLMRESGLDPEDAARLFDGIGPGRDNLTHPAPSRRAAALRQLAPALALRRPGQPPSASKPKPSSSALPPSATLVTETTL